MSAGTETADERQAEAAGAVVDRGARRVLLVGLLIAGLLRIYLAIGNYGFVAMDDYSEILAWAVPAQQSPPMAQVIDTTSIRSPVPRLAVLAVTRIGNAVGLDSPVNQVRFLYTVLGLLSLIAVWAVWWMFHRLGSPRWARASLWWTGGHFLAVYLTTRALIENMALPLLTVSTVLLCLYSRERKVGLLATSLVFLAAASVFRFQVGVVALVVLLVPAWHRRWGDLAAALAVGIGAFLVTGWIDVLLRGSFHGSLRSYLAYNLAYSSDFGVSPWYGYILLLLAAALPFLLIGSYRGFPWRRYFELLWPAVLVVAVFVAAHSAVPHKEDRFMVPIMAVWFGLLAPLFEHLDSRAATRWRSAVFATLNIALVALIGWVPSQNNVIGPVRWLGDKPEVERLWSVDGSAYPFVSKYATRVPPQLVDVSSAAEVARDHDGCGDVMAIRSDILVRSGPPEGWREVASFGPGLPERFIIMINPGRNLRRNPIHLFQPDGCGAGQQPRNTRPE